MRKQKILNLPIAGSGSACQDSGEFETESNSEFDQSLLPSTPLRFAGEGSDFIVSSHASSEKVSVRSIFNLAARISKGIGVKPSKWREFLLFTTIYSKNLDIDVGDLEKRAKLEHLEPSDRHSEEEVRKFEATQLRWFSRNCCRELPSYRRAYVHPNSLDRYQTLATILAAVFPDLVRRRPRNTLESRRRWRALKSAWREEKKRTRETRSASRRRGR